MMQLWLLLLDHYKNIDNKVAYKDVKRQVWQDVQKKVVLQSVNKLSVRSFVCKYFFSLIL